MTLRLDGMTALVSAAGQGIGRASALALAREGARVTATDINERLLADLAAEAPCIATRVLDVRDGAAILSAAEAAGGPDILVNCAGFVHHGTILDCAEADYDFSFDLNVKSLYRMIRAFLPPMLERGGGAIVNISSVASSIKGAPNRFVYGATKAAVIGMTKSLAADFITRGIRCNAICPGTVETPSLHERFAAQGDVDKARASFIARQPMGRLGRPEEIAELVVYLGSRASGFLTGQTIIIDGGWSL